jgi:hypothetical protein
VTFASGKYSRTLSTNAAISGYFSRLLRFFSSTSVMANPLFLLVKWKKWYNVEFNFVEEVFFVLAKRPTYGGGVSNSTP